jgi:hypothetical protein
VEVLLAVAACFVAAIALALLIGATRRVRLLEDQIKQVLAGRDAEELLGAGSREPARSSRRWLSFRLRTLLLWMGIIGCLLGWFGSELHRAEKQRMAVNTFESFGAVIGYNFEEPGSWVCFPSDRRPPLPRWTRQMFGDDFGARVLSIQFQAPLQSFGSWQPTRGFDAKSYALTDDDLALLRDLPDLTYLSLSYTDVTDDAFRHLTGLHDLKRLRLANTYVTGSRLRELATLPRLDSLDLTGSKLNDEAMPAVSELPHLTELIVSQHITDAGLAWLSASPTIEALDLTGAPITDDGLRHVATMQQLTALKLNETEVGDAGLEHLKQLPDLRLLHLDGTAVTADGLAHLKELPRLHVLSLRIEEFEGNVISHLAALANLQQLCVAASAVAESERAGLKAALPDTQIDYADPTIAGFGGGTLGGGGGFF